MKSLIKKIIKSVTPESVLKSLGSIPLLTSTSYQIHDRILHETWQAQVGRSKNPLNKTGAKYFSQTDEDGITLEILQRLNITSGAFAEFGVGDGSENNTLILIANKWKGFWVGGQSLFFTVRDDLKNFCFTRKWIDLENIVGLARDSMSRIGCESLDLISLDLDGNDIYFVEALLKDGFLPKVFIVEYNAKFAPPIEFQIEYNARHTWMTDDYWGASLTSYAKLFSKYQYFLVCCNAHTGVNAFFVREEFAHRFSDVPRDLKDLYYGPRYQLYKQFGFKPSPKTIERLLSVNETQNVPT